MKKLSEVYNELRIDFTFPIKVKDKNGNSTYLENVNDFWHRIEYDENSKATYYENSYGYWYRYEYDENGKETYFENSDGKIRGTKRKSFDDKVIEVNGKKYKLTEL